MNHNMFDLEGENGLHLLEIDLDKNINVQISVEIAHDYCKCIVIVWPCDNHFFPSVRLLTKSYMKEYSYRGIYEIDRYLFLRKTR